MIFATVMHSRRLIKQPTENVIPQHFSRDNSEFTLTPWHKKILHLCHIPYTTRWVSVYPWM